MNSLACIFGKNFVKVTVLLNKYSRVDLTKYSYEKLKIRETEYNQSENGFQYKKNRPIDGKCPVIIVAEI